MALTSEQKQDLCNLADKALAKYDIYPMDIDFNVTGRVAGVFRPSNFTMGFNEVLAAQNYDTFVGTILHEVAHAIDFTSSKDKEKMTVRKHRGGRRDMHGRYFKEILNNLLAEFGIQKQATTYHSYDVGPRKKQRRWEYTCATCNFTYKIATVTHNRMQKGQMRICKCGADFGASNFTGKQL